MTFKTVYLNGHISYVKDFDFVVPWTCEEPISVDRVPSYLVDSVIVGFNQLHDFSISRIPNSQVLVFAASQN